MIDPRPEVISAIGLSMRCGTAAGSPAAPGIHGEEPLCDENLQPSLHLCYELHYRGLDGVDPRFEWDPDLLAFRTALEAAFERALHDAVGPRVPPLATDLDVPRALVEVAQMEAGASLSRYLTASTHARYRPRPLGAVCSESCRGRTASNEKGGR